MTYDVNRRQFVEGVGYTALGLAVAAALPTVARAASGSPDFDSGLSRSPIWCRV